MSQQLFYSMFHDVLFPKEAAGSEAVKQNLFLQRVLRYLPAQETIVRQATLVIFDFETTGLDPATDRIIEIGGLKVVGGKPAGEFSTLIKPDIPLPKTAAQITGITEEMLEGQPAIEDVLPKFLEFIEGAILVAHNAEFDMSFLRTSCERLGYQISWPCFCTLKLSRSLLPDLESRTLDSLATHYGLTFEARHRSIGDCKVTSSVLQALLANEGRSLVAWQDLQPFAVAHSR